MSFDREFFLAGRSRAHLGGLCWSFEAAPSAVVSVPLEDPDCCDDVTAELVVARDVEASNVG